MLKGLGERAVASVKGIGRKSGSKCQRNREKER